MYYMYNKFGFFYICCNEWNKLVVYSKFVYFVFNKVWFIYFKKFNFLEFNFMVVNMVLYEDW